MTHLARRLVAAVVLASLAPTAGCSVVFVSGPKKIAPGRFEPDGCSTSRVAPIIDTVLLGLWGGAAVSEASRNATEGYGTGVDRGTSIAVGVTLAALSAASAFYGYATVATCRRVIAEQPDRGPQPEDKRTREERAADEAAEEEAVQARVNAKAAADAKAAGEAASRGPGAAKKQP